MCVLFIRQLFCNKLNIAFIHWMVLATQKKLTSWQAVNKTSHTAMISPVLAKLHSDISTTMKVSSKLVEPLNENSFSFVTLISILPSTPITATFGWWYEMANSY